MMTRQKLAVLLASVLMLGLSACGKQDTSEGGTAMNSPAESGANPTASSSQPGITDQAAVAVNDASITAQIKAAYMGDSSLQASQIEVDTKDGVVALMGAVVSQEEKDKAEQVAAGVDGVKAVDNRLAVKTGGVS